MGWTANSKRYKEGLRHWYCCACDKRTVIELNPLWIAQGKPLKWEGDIFKWEWFTRCAECKLKQWDEGSFDCPNCGCSSEHEPGDNYRDEEYGGTLIQITKGVLNSRYSYDYGVTGYDWDERHQCRKCRTRWWFTNSSC